MAAVRNRRHHDSYRDLEAFIQKTQEDIGNIFSPANRRANRLDSSGSTAKNGICASDDHSIQVNRFGNRAMSTSCAPKSKCVTKKRGHRDVIVDDEKLGNRVKTSNCKSGIVNRRHPPIVNVQKSRPKNNFDPLPNHEIMKRENNLVWDNDRVSNRKKRSSIKRSVSDLSSDGTSFESWKQKYDQKKEKDRLDFVRPPSMDENSIDILKSWAEDFALQVNNAFSSLESLTSGEENDDRKVQDFNQNFIPLKYGDGRLATEDECGNRVSTCTRNNDANGVQQRKHDCTESIFSKQNENFEEQATDGSLANSADILSPEIRVVDPPRHRRSSSSSSSSQVRPDEIVKFLKRVEESIRTSSEVEVNLEEACDSANDSVFMDDEQSMLTQNLNSTTNSCCGQDAVTQTSPTVSASSSFVSMLNLGVDKSPAEARISPTAIEVDTVSEEPSSTSPGIVDVSSSTFSTSEDELKDQPSGSSGDPSNNDSSSLSLSRCSLVSSSLSENTPEGSNGDVASQSTPLGEEIIGEITAPPQKSTGNYPNVNEKLSKNTETTPCERCRGDTVNVNSRSLPVSYRMKHHLEPSSSYSLRPRKPDKKSRTFVVSAIVHSTADSIERPEVPVKSKSAPSISRKNNHNGFRSEDSSPTASGESTLSSSDVKPADIKKRLPASTFKSLSRKQLAELEAIEACSWLRAAGFPQYAQMYEEHQFPVEINSVQKDHYFLDQDSIQSLFRRLNILNRCAKMKINSVRRQSVVDDSDEEDSCALSENWMFLRSNRRWSRVNQEDDFVINAGERKSASPSHKSLTVPSASAMEAHSSFDSVLTADDYYSSQPSNVQLSVNGSNDVFIDPSPSSNKGDDSGSSTDSPVISRHHRSSSAERHCDDHIGNFHRSGSERLKDGAKALFRRMESLKSRHRKRSANNSSNRGIVIVDDSLAANSSSVRQRLKPPELVLDSDDNGQCSVMINNDSFVRSTSSRRKSSGRRFYNGSVRNMDSEALSDSECSNATSPSMFPTYLATDTNSNNTSLLEQYWRATRLSPGSPKSSNRNKVVDNSSEDVYKDGNERVSVYDNVPNVFFRQDIHDKSGEILTIEDDGQQTLPINTTLILVDIGQDDVISDGSIKNKSSDDSREDIVVRNHERRDSGVGLSLSRQISSKRQSMLLVSGQISINSLSMGQIMVLRKLSLLKLTAMMERYSPSNRSGWNWAMPKFIKRIKNPDYKDKKVFGLPLLLILQRTGHQLPQCIQSAIEYLRLNSIDCVGLFRKSGVRSRIQQLKNLIENHQEKLNFENYQSYDVADILKQYFRELPEALLTNKLSETFISIFQYIPMESRLEAIQAAILLMPDENREILHSLLSFLSDVSNRANENQMTASNLAVCFAPSLFHMNAPRNTGSSPRRRKIVGVPDQKELKENKAAHECLSQMIAECPRLFSVSEEVLNQCRYSYAEHNELITLDDLSTGDEQNTFRWDRYVEFCIQGLVKETRIEKSLTHSKGWIPFTYPDNSALVYYKKVGDGNPLRLWKVTTDVEAPPFELLNKVLYERHVWDDSLIKWQSVCKIDRQTEICHYVTKSVNPHPNREFSIIRTWRTDLNRGSCLLIETSIDHPIITLSTESVKGIVLASRYLVEPCGSGKSRITHVSRIDTRGRSPEWYNRVYGHIIALHLRRIRDSFRHGTDGPETKV